MGHHRFTVHVDAPRRQVFDLWTNLDRVPEWIEGLTRITDVTGPPDRAGTRYIAWFGRVRSPTEILEADRPRLVKTRFGSWLLRGITQATFEEDGDGTRLTQEFWTDGIIPAIMARIFATGSYKGSFRGELNSFARLAEREGRSDR
ncbi:MAG: SRPBCC family protein [Jiangellaceae bacterium]|nr:SRPBCC family protein [Jiangellaceae bacterium]